MAFGLFANQNIYSKSMWAIFFILEPDSWELQKLHLPAFYMVGKRCLQMFKINFSITTERFSSGGIDGNYGN